MRKSSRRGRAVRKEGRYNKPTPIFPDGVEAASYGLQDLPPGAQDLARQINDVLTGRPFKDSMMALGFIAAMAAVDFSRINGAPFSEEDQLAAHVAVMPVLKDAMRQDSNISRLPTRALLFAATALLVSAGAYHTWETICTTTTDNKPAEEVGEDDTQ